MKDKKYRTFNHAKTRIKYHLIFSTKYRKNVLEPINNVNSRELQQTYNLSDGSMAKYTSARWLRPNGSCIDGVGLIPDYVANMTYTYDETGVINGTIDSQLSKAIEVISAM